MVCQILHDTDYVGVGWCRPRPGARESLGLVLASVVERRKVED